MQVQDPHLCIYVERCKYDKYFGNMQYFMNKIWIKI